MNLNNIYKFNNRSGISDIYTFSGSCGVYDGCDSVTEKTENGFLSVRDSFTVKADICETDGVFERCDTIENTSYNTITLNHYAYRFCFDGGDFEVYTQASNWQNDSDGEWAKLVTCISASAKGVRTADGAVPMAAVYNRQTNRGVVFHILPEYAWEICVTKKTDGTRALYTVVEISINDKALSLDIEKGESLRLAPVVYYEFRDKLSLDCHKLHRWFTNKYPRRELPVVYNTWFTFFDRVDIPLIFEQIKESADLGCEYFMIDAGWFGKGNWEEWIGTWVENENGGYKGRLKDVSDEVHRNNMKFGLWLEPERALANAQAVNEHPEYFFKNEKSYFLDFANEEARKYIFEITCGLIDKYNIDYIKFDFNDNISYDPSKKAFYDYRKGHIEYVKEIKRRYPDIYLENCASGGQRMELEQARWFDSFWFSDNQSLYEGLSIIKNTIRRLPAYLIERYVALISAGGFVPAYGTDISVRTLATNNATWDSVVSVNAEYVKGFFTGGPVGITFDITKLDEEFKEELRSFIAEYKKERVFWMNASCRILCDTENFLVLQYEYNDKIKVVVTSFVAEQSSFTFYPVLEKGEYSVNGEKISSKSLEEYGITVENVKNNYSFTYLIEGI